MTQAVFDPPLGARTVDLILLALAVALLPHLTHLPVIITLFCLAFAAWRWIAAHHGWSLPGMPTRTLLTLLALSAVVLSYGTVFGRDAGAALLAIMLGLKLLEVRHFRDGVVVLFLGYFLAVAMVLFSQELYVIGFLAIALLLITAALIDLNHASRAAPAAPLSLILRRSGALLLQAVPLMLVMFLLFPRIPGPLWSLPEDAYGSSTGLSDSMSPGSISELGRSDTVAFRVSFDDAVPAPEQLYWRGPVFWYTDGSNWSTGPRQGEPGRIELPDIVPQGSPVSYNITLEPHNRRWLFALEMPYAIPGDSSHTEDLLLLADKPVRQLTRYQVTSYPDYVTTMLDPGARERALQLPPANPRALALGKAWRAELRSDRAVVERALEHFRVEPFHYTLTPPLLGDDPVDDFLFGTRRGFCEHYAAAFTLLMRAAGIPTRVVTGYQGGELNPLGDYLIVRQRDAHAWAEVWLADRGWVRIDPTAAVAPHRIEHGSADVFSREQSALRTVIEQGLIGALWRHSRFGWDTVNNRWNQWVLGYGPENQLAFLSRIGLRNWADMAFAMLITVALILFAIAVIVLLRSPTGDPVARLYRLYCAKLARAGIRHRPAEGPAEFAARAVAIRPDLARVIEDISKRYIAIRYGGVNTPGQLRRLQRDIRNLRP